MTAYEVKRVLSRKLPGDAALRGAEAKDTARIATLSRGGFKIAHVAEVVSQERGMHYEFWMERPYEVEEEAPVPSALTVTGDVVTDTGFSEDMAAKIAAKQAEMIAKQQAEQDGVEYVPVIPLVPDSVGSENLEAEDFINAEGLGSRLTVSELADSLEIDRGKMRNRIASRKLRDKEDWPFAKEHTTNSPNGVFVGDEVAVMAWADQRFGDMIGG